MTAAAYEESVRAAAMAWLDELDPDKSRVFRRDELATFTFAGRRIPLVNPQAGIHKPAGFAAALSILTTFTRPGETPPYEDGIGADGLTRYKYRGHNPLHADNVALRQAFYRHLPLIWFVAATRGAYVPIYPVWIAADEPEQLQCAIVFEKAQSWIASAGALDGEQRKYVQRLTHQRLHQPLFRTRVLTAYDHQCAICRLRYDSLLDAAHILPDTHPMGTPDVPNGLSLCKIHHAAYDQNLLGVRPDLVVTVRPDVQRSHDGPMLLHGLQAMDGVKLVVPTERRAKPDPARLQQRYQDFLSAG